MDSTLRQVDTVLAQLARARQPRLRAYALARALEELRPGLASVVGGAAQGMIASGVAPAEALRQSLAAVLEALAANSGLGTGETPSIASMITGISSSIAGVLGMGSTIMGYQTESMISDFSRRMGESSALQERTAAEAQAALALDALERTEEVERIRAAMPTSEYSPTGSSGLLALGAGALPTWAYLVGGAALIGALVGGAYWLAR